MEKLYERLKPFYQEHEEIITFVYPKPHSNWKVISTALIGRNEDEKWETLVAKGEKGSVEGVDLELLGFRPEEGKVTSQTIFPTVTKKVDKDVSILTQHLDELFKAWGSDIRCVSGWREPIIVCSPLISKISEKIKKTEDFWKFREEVIDKFAKKLEEIV